MQSQLNQILAEETGLTLVELVIVVVIIGIVVAISAPNMKVWQQHSRVNRDARNLLGAFQQARIEAVKRSEFCSVAFNQAVDGVTYDYVVFFDEWDPADPTTPNRVLDAGEDVFLKADFGYATPTPNFTPNPEAAIFNNRGLPSNSSSSVSMVIGSVDLTAEDYTRTVTISRSGRVRIE